VPYPVLERHDYYPARRPLPGPGALGRQLIELLRQSRKAAIAFSVCARSVLSSAACWASRAAKSALGGEAGGICGIIRNVDWRTSLATIASVSVTVSAASKVADPNAALLLIGEPSIVGDKVMQTMGGDPPGGFQPGMLYDFVVTVRPDTGWWIAQGVEIMCKPVV
jgi:hypothetical protein